MQALLDALNGANIDTSSLIQMPDGAWHLPTPGGGLIAFSEHGGWWGATVYDADDITLATINTASLTDLAAQFARWDVARVVAF